MSEKSGFIYLSFLGIGMAFAGLISGLAELIMGNLSIGIACLSLTQMGCIFICLGQMTSGLFPQLEGALRIQIAGYIGCFTTILVLATGNISVSFMVMVPSVAVTAYGLWQEHKLNQHNQKDNIK